MPSRQNLAHGADLHGDMFDTVEDRAVRAAENDIAVFSHQFDDKQLAAEVTHLVQMFDLKMNTAFQTRLADGHDASASDVLAKQHAEIRGSHGSLLVGIRQICQRKTCVDREKKPFRLPEVLYGKKKFIALGLRDLCDLAAGKRVTKLLNQVCDYNSVKCHGFGAPLFV